jgi:hypothetical protein
MCGHSSTECRVKFGSSVYTITKNAISVSTPSGEEGLEVELQRELYDSRRIVRIESADSSKRRTR